MTRLFLKTAALLLCIGIAGTGCGHKGASAEATAGTVMQEEAVAQHEATTQNDSIRKALEHQREHYPASQYRDVYKNFMQDFFGPGHILASVEGAEAYLKREMEETEAFDGPPYEPTGFQGNFYRVNIGLVKDGTIPYDVFFDTFVSSVSGIVPPDPEYWMGIWKTVDGVIADMGWTFDNEATDREAMARQFAEGNYIVHHSDAYNKAVNFHYRIISRPLFEEKILPYLRRHKS